MVVFILVNNVKILHLQSKMEEITFVMFMGLCIVNIFQYVSNKMQLSTVYLYLETALQVLGGTSTHHQEHIQLYLQHLVCAPDDGWRYHPKHVEQFPDTRYVRKVMRLIFLGQAEWLGSRISGPDDWWGMSGKRSDPAQLPLSLYRVRIACEVDSCLSLVSWVKMQRSVDQEYAMKFCIKLKKSVTETLAMIQKAYGKDALLKAQVFRWHKAFREGREDVKDEQRIRRPSTSHTLDNVAKAKAVLDSDRV